MLKTFDYDDIKRQFLDFLADLGIQPYDDRDIIIDGELHRYRIHDDKSYHKSGAFCIFPEGLPAGFAQDWRTGTKKNWKFDTSGLPNEQREYFNSEAYRKEAEEKRKLADEERKKKRLIQSDKARILWGSLNPAPADHPYLLRKNVRPYNLRVHPTTNFLAVPLKDIRGSFMSIQWIPPDEGKHKLFFEGASLDGAFWSIGFDTLNPNYDGIILLGEGYATMAKVCQLTDFPCAAAMSCYRLFEIAQAIRKKFPKCKIIIVADNDWETELERDFNPGIHEAQNVSERNIAQGFVVPDFTPDDKGCSDWDDFALKFGDEKTTEIIINKIQWQAMDNEQKDDFMNQKKLSALLHGLDPAVDLPPQEFIGGIFPRNFVSLLIAPPGTGKTIFMQKFCSDLSIGGNIFDGFAENEPIRKTLILAGEAGFELLTRRAASMKWPVNPLNVRIIDQYESETNDVELMLDTKNGISNLYSLTNMVKPDILFIDTFSSFHESDENKAPAMKPIIKQLAALARQFHIAVVLVHHSRKRLAKERSLSLNQDDVIGSSILNRLVGLIVGIEPMKDDENVLLVQPLKSWFSRFMPFTYTLKEGFYGGTVVETDLVPAGINNSKSAVLMYLSENFNNGQWFSISQIVLSQIEGHITDRQLRRVMSDLVKKGILSKRGSTKDTEYSMI